MTIYPFGGIRVPLPGLLVSVFLVKNKIVGCQQVSIAAY